LRDADAEPAVGGECAVKIFREFAVAIALEPIIVTETRADFLNRVAHRLLQLGEGEIDGRHS
jgi:hypothetical protein